MTKFVVNLVAAIATIMGGIAFGQSASVDREYHVKQALAAGKRSEFAWHYYQAFEEIDDAALQAFLTHANDGIAIRAAWHRVRRFARYGGDEAEVIVNARDSHRFIGFVEGRLKVEIPDWWSGRLRRIRFRGVHRIEGHTRHRQHPKLFMRNVMVKDVPNPKYHTLAKRWSSPLGIELRRNKGALDLVVGGEAIALPDSPVRELERSISLSALRVGKRSCLFIPYAFGQSPLFFIENEKVVWESQIWGEDSVGKTGPTERWMEMVYEGPFVYVFGGDFDALFLECFDVSDGGRAVFRFGTSY